MVVHGESNISREFRVPTQVGVRDDGTFVTDFPFDNPKYSPDEKKEMSQTTRRSLGLRRRKSVKLKAKQRTEALQLSALEDYKGKGVTPPKNASSSFEEDCSASDYFNTSVSTIEDGADICEQSEEIEKSSILGPFDLPSDVECEEESTDISEHCEQNENYSAVGALDLSLDVQRDDIDHARPVSELPMIESCKVIVTNTKSVEDVSIRESDNYMSDDEEIDVLNCSINPDDDEESVNGHDGTDVINDSSETASHTTFTSQAIESESDTTTSESSNSIATNDNVDRHSTHSLSDGENTDNSSVVSHADSSVMVTPQISNGTDAEVIDSVNQMTGDSSAVFTAGDINNTTAAHSSEDITQQSTNTAEVSESNTELTGDSSAVFTAGHMNNTTVAHSSEDITQQSTNTAEVSESNTELTGDSSAVFTAGHMNNTTAAHSSEDITQQSTNTAEVSESNTELTGESSVVFTPGLMKTDTMEDTSLISEDVAEPSRDIIVISSDTIQNSSTGEKSQIERDVHTDYTVGKEKEESVNDSESVTGNSQEHEEDAMKDHSYAVSTILPILVRIRIMSILRLNRK